MPNIGDSMLPKWEVPTHIPPSTRRTVVHKLLDFALHPDKVVWESLAEKDRLLFKQLKRRNLIYIEMPHEDLLSQEYVNLYKKLVEVKKNLVAHGLYAVVAPSNTSKKRRKQQKKQKLASVPNNEKARW